MRPSLAALLFLALAACGRSEAGRPAAPAPARDAAGFPRPARPVAANASPLWSSSSARDAVDESGQLIRGLDIRPGMAVADVGAGSGYHTLRLSPAVGPRGVVYAEDIVGDYIASLRREARRRKLSNVRVVVGEPDDPKLPPRAIDRVVMVHMYHEVKSPYALLWRLAGAMKPDGRVGVVDLDRPSSAQGVPLALLRCEFEAVGYRLVDLRPLSGDAAYLAVFAPPRPGALPAPQSITPCVAPAA